MTIEESVEFVQDLIDNQVEVSIEMTDPNAPRLRCEVVSVEEHLTDGWRVTLGRGEDGFVSSLRGFMIDLNEGLYRLVGK